MIKWGKVGVYKLLGESVVSNNVFFVFNQMPGHSTGLDYYRTLYDFILSYLFPVVLDEPRFFLLPIHVQFLFHFYSLFFLSSLVFNSILHTVPFHKHVFGMKP